MHHYAHSKCYMLILCWSVMGQLPAMVLAAEADTVLAPQKVEITSTRLQESEERQESTAAKFILGRAEIERFGDTRTVDLLKRLPGVTVPGASGRGGAPRMRGLGSGFTQVLVDGQRLPAGFSLDDIPPDQIERIEVMRAPTAETGSRAIAGTIQLFLRQGYKKRLHDVKASLAYEWNKPEARFTWSRNDVMDEFTYNLSVSAFNRDTFEPSRSLTTIQAIGGPEQGWQERMQFSRHREGLHTHARLNWKTPQGSNLTLNPMLVVSNSQGQTVSNTQPLPPDSSFGPPFAAAQTHTQNTFQMARINGTWVQTTDQGGRIEWRSGLNRSEWTGNNQRFEQNSAGANLTAQAVTSGFEMQDSGVNTAVKYSYLTDANHQWVWGAEAEYNHRDEIRDAQSALALGQEWGDNLGARVLQLSAYGQDEWAINPKWSVQAGLRWEGIRTTGGFDQQPQRNMSRVLSPLLHSTWKLDPERRDQIRLSLTRSYRPPSLYQLLGNLPTPTGTNSATRPYRVGNPDLKPELATGLDLGYERYLSNNGVLSANVFYRQIHDYIRYGVSEQITPSGTTYISSPQNVARAHTQGLELEAKFKLNDWLHAMPALDVRSNLGLFQSKVQGLPEPHNRLDEQPQASLNLGVDYRLKSLPLSWGGNYHAVPANRIQVQSNQLLSVGSKEVLDIYATYTQSAHQLWRLSVNNATSHPVDTQRTVSLPAQIEKSRMLEPTTPTWRLMLEMKL